MSTNITMKLWELDSILNWAFNNGAHRELPKVIANSNTDWQNFASWFNDYDNFVVTQNQMVLESELPIDFTQAVLSKVNKHCYLSKKDGHLRSYQFRADDEPLTFLECFNRYGGTVLEDVLEKGSYCVNLSMRSPH